MMPAGEHHPRGVVGVDPRRRAEEPRAVQAPGDGDRRPGAERRERRGRRQSPRPEAPDRAVVLAGGVDAVALGPREQALGEALGDDLQEGQRQHHAQQRPVQAHLVGAAEPQRQRVGPRCPGHQAVGDQQAEVQRAVDPVGKRAAHQQPRARQVREPHRTLRAGGAARQQPQARPELDDDQRREADPMDLADRQRGVLVEQDHHHQAQDAGGQHQQIAPQHEEHGVDQRLQRDQRVVGERQAQRPGRVGAGRGGEDPDHQPDGRRGGNARQEHPDDDAPGELVLAGLLEQRAEEAQRLDEPSGDHEGERRRRRDQRRVEGREVDVGVLRDPEGQQRDQLQTDRQEEVGAASQQPDGSAQALGQRLRPGRDRAGLASRPGVGQPDLHRLGEREDVAPAVALGRVAVADPCALQQRGDRPHVDRPAGLGDDELRQLLERAARRPHRLDRRRAHRVGDGGSGRRSGGQADPARGAAFGHAAATSSESGRRGSARRRS